MQITVNRTNLPPDRQGQMRITAAVLDISHTLSGQEEMAVILHEKIEQILSTNIWRWRNMQHWQVSQIADELAVFLSSIGVSFKSEGQVVTTPEEMDGAVSYE